MKPTLFSHRGANRLAPENTIPAFSLAKQLGAKWLETDLDLLPDGTVVLIHDATLDRTTDRVGPVSNLTEEDLAAVDAGSWFHEKFAGTPIPTLDQLVEFMNAEQMNANLELKADATNPASPEQLVAATLRAVDRLAPERQVVFSSFSVPHLQVLHQMTPQFPTAVLYRENQIPEDWDEDARKTGATRFHLHDGDADEPTVRQFLDAGYGVSVFTVNDAARAEDLLSWGVTGIFSDVPTLLL